MITSLLLGVLAVLGPTNQDLSFAETVVRVRAGEDLLALRDLDGDGARELLFVGADGIGIRYLGRDGRYSAENDAFLAWPSDHLAWDLGDLDGDGAVEIVTLIEGRRIQAWKPSGRDLIETSGPLLEVRSYLPRGITSMAFLRDVDADGAVDLVLPGSDRFDIWLADASGGWREPLQISFDARVDHRVGDPDQLSEEFGQSLSVPWFRLEDIDGDGTQDLVAEADDRVSFYLASPELPRQATWTLDLAALKAELPVEDGINLDDLMSHAARRVSWKVADLDGQAPADLVVQVGSTFKVYLGGAGTGPRREASQVLRSSGNAVYFFLRDVEGSPLPELQLVRGEEISLTTILRWLILPGSLDFDLFTYRNREGQLSRRPTKRNQVSFAIPRLLAFSKKMEGMEEDLREKALVPARRVDLFGAGIETDVVDLKGGEVLIYRGQAPEIEGFDWTALLDGDWDGFLEASFLTDLDALDDGETKSLDLGAIDEWSFSPGFELRRACAELVPDARFPLAMETEEYAIVPRDLDGDGRLDLVIVGREEDEFVVQFLVLGGTR